ncbi:lipocalin-like domain-containing protein [Fluviibacterium sp. DFM31]|uniref:Lipocalin-like domain-containing protein n=1 Tax=Meridianimarinicoccus marinus TaxID=3231483 RepID=A0ABV3L136_9RHOB
MGSDADGFLLPAPGVALSFPRDHGAHPGFRIEWWYVTANLEDAGGRAIGAQWTLFRASLSPDPGEGWSSSQIWFAHAGLTEADRHFTAQRFARGGIGQAGVTARPFHAWINDWAMTGADDSADALDSLQMQARGEAFAYDLALTAEGPLVPHGEGGFSVKSPRGQASYYYSQPHYRVTGTLDLPEGPVNVTGTAWLDREWSSQPLAPSQTGWDWFSLHLEDGSKLMVYRLRDADAADFVPATHILPDGTARHIPDGAITLTPEGTAQVAGREIPVRWRIQWPDKGYDLHTAPLNPQSWMDTNVPYWEGPVTVRGSHSGQGYLEMTGYE